MKKYTVQGVPCSRMTLTCSGVLLAELPDPPVDCRGSSLRVCLDHLVLDTSQHALQFVCHRKVRILGKSGDRRTLNLSKTDLDDSTPFSYIKKEKVFEYN